jgi:hypothetical protein
MTAGLGRGWVLVENQLGRELDTTLAQTRAAKTLLIQ